MTEDRMLSMKQVCEYFGGCHRSKIHRLRKNDKFPKPKIWGRSVLWESKEIIEYKNSMEVGK